MTDELTKKAADMLLQGATLVSEPCPYCKGVRVIKNGDALCISCGRAPEKNKPRESAKKPTPVLQTLEKKLNTLSEELETETDHLKQQDIIKAIDSLVETIGKLKSVQ